MEIPFYPNMQISLDAICRQLAKQELRAQLNVRIPRLMGRPPDPSQAPVPTSQPSGQGWSRPCAFRSTMGGGTSVLLEALAMTQLQRQCMVRCPNPGSPAALAPGVVSQGRTRQGEEFLFS